jgi:hypothetical protein
VSRRANLEEDYAVVCADPLPPGETPNDVEKWIAVKEIWWTLEEGEAQYTRVRRRS